MSEFVWKCAESRRTQAARRKQERLAREEEDLLLAQEVDSGVEPLPAILQQVSNAGDSFEQSLEVPTACLGQIIGKKGKNLKQVQDKFNVKVSIKEGASSDVQAVTIAGKSLRSVAEAAKELDVVVERVSVPGEMTRWLCGKSAQHLRFLRDLTGVPVLSFCREGNSGTTEDATAAAPAPAEEEQEGEGAVADDRKPRGLPVPGYVEIIGDRESVSNAKLCLEAHMSYFPVVREMEAIERELDAKISAAMAELPDLPRSRLQPSSAEEPEEDYWEEEEYLEEAYDEYAEEWEEEDEEQQEELEEQPTWAAHDSVDTGQVHSTWSSQAAVSAGAGRGRWARGKMNYRT
mmetsp:Transcript_64431/g.153725  ORF Transcript_64431/g.153725 Transcript_64431/m.153725 type:complete len:347 (-) Transcript_64431:60-1100(-)|eukprot:CAMPEP_0178396382 /NCGR_PEP_ID=MMETSP0689_2-20121128/13700_1 /TAXON_ID=160604 /ORGANISM="Amphidinium massartii, Strain CS-259" /LENGTH=346 /DNA_ID=CAMNT_0020017055 /DNA_START=163 /DNA_END=1203 /DNA_ORIENTATION=+